MTKGLDPGQLAAAYGVSSLWKAGYEGQNQSVAIIENGDSPNVSKFKALSACYGPYALPKHYVLHGTGTPLPEKEGILDPQVVAAIAPKADIYMIESGQGNQIQKVLPKLLDAALDPARTGGRLVDSITISIAACEVSWSPAQIAAAEAALRYAASLGVAVFAAAGDAGSVASYTSPPHVSPCIEDPHQLAGEDSNTVKLGVNYPASSPEVTAVGGTELEINGNVPEQGDATGGAITSEIVWNQPDVHETAFHWAGGGGESALLHRRGRSLASRCRCFR